MNTTKLVYIFRNNNELLVSKNGVVKKSRWEYLGNNSLLIDQPEESYLFKHGFFDENVLALKIDSREEYAFLINETKYEGELNSLDNVFEFLESKYRNRNSGNGTKEFGKEEIRQNISSQEKVLENGDILTFIRPSSVNITIDCEVRINGNVPPDCIVRLRNEDLRYEIKNGKTIMEFYIETHKQPNGEVLELDGNRINGIVKGSRAWINGKPAHTGIYKTGLFSRVTVKDGVVESKNLF